MSSPIASAACLTLGNETHRFDLDAFGLRIRAQSDSAEGLRLLSRCIFPSLPHSAHEARNPDIVVRIGQADSQYGVLVEDRIVASAPCLDGRLEASIVRALDDVVIAHLPSWRVIHAGVVGWDGCALLLPGRTHAGKSTLVAELVRRGAVYFSDEYALIDADGLVHPYPRPMLLRNGRPESVAVAVAESGTAPLPVGWILGLTFEPGSSWDPLPKDQSQAIMLLLQSTPHVLSTSPELIRYFERAVARARTYIGCRPDVVPSSDEILRLMSGSACRAWPLSRN